MAVFPVLELETKVQTNEKTRLSGLKSYLTQNEAAVILVRIQPSALDSFITVSALDATDSSFWFLDWQYSAIGIKTVVLEITNDVGTPVITTFSKDIDVTDAATERLFSTDQDLMSEEPDILRFIRDGKSSFLDLHRTAQIKILDDIYRRKILDSSGAKLTIDNVIDIEELKQWSKYMVLRLIFQSVSNKVDDIFAAKSSLYAKLEQAAMNEAMNQMKIDYNNDGLATQEESKNFRSGDLVRA